MSRPTPPPRSTLPRVVPLSIRVVRAGTDWSVRTSRPILAGEPILSFHGRIVGRPGRHSLQLSARRHLDGPELVPPESMQALYGWRFLNHSCDPNGAVQDMTLVALRDIPADAEVTFDYNTTEWDMSHPFHCGCGAARCCGAVRGFRHLDAEARARILPWASEHLRVRAERGLRPRRSRTRSVGIAEDPAGSGEPTL